MGSTHVQHRFGPGEEDEMQLPQSNPGGEEAAGRATRGPQETPQRRNGQVVDQAGLPSDTDARFEETQQRRHQDGQGSQVASGSGSVAQPEAKMHVSEIKGIGAFATGRTARTIASATATTSTGGTSSREASYDTRTGEEALLLRVAGRRTTGRTDHRACSRETGTEEARQRGHKASENRESPGETEAGKISRESRQSDVEEMGRQGEGDQPRGR